MSRKLKRPRTVQPILRCLNQNAAGIDVGASAVYIAVPPDRDGAECRDISRLNVPRRPISTQGELDCDEATT